MGEAIRIIFLLLAVGCSLLIPAPVCAQGIDTIRKIDEILAQAYPPDRPGAAVIVKKGNRVLLRKGYGLADPELRIRISPKTLFPIGSITKQFTAAVVLRLIERGKCSLDSSITQFFPDLPMPFYKVTIEHLLTHTSGIKTYTGLPDYLEWFRKSQPPTEIIDRIKNVAFDFSPGEGWKYNDSGYFLLGLLIEKLERSSYESALKSLVFNPSRMRNSLCDHFDSKVARRAIGHTQKGATFSRTPDVHPQVSFAAGALVSTVDDLLAWSEALDKGLVTKDLLARALTPYRLANGRSTNYGFGWTFSRYKDHLIQEHGGRIGGFESHILRVPDERIVVVILTNILDHQPNPDFLASRIASYLLGAPYDPIAIKLSTAQLQEYVATFGVNDRAMWQIVLEGEDLYLKRTGRSDQLIRPAGNDRFFYENSMTYMQFERDGEGRIRKLSLYPEYGEDIRMDRIKLDPEGSSTSAARFPSAPTTAPPRSSTPTPEHQPRR